MSTIQVQNPILVNPNALKNSTQVKGVGIGGRVISVFTSALISPLSVLHGTVATAWNIGKLVGCYIESQKSHSQSNTLSLTEKSISSDLNTSTLSISSSEDSESIQQPNLVSKAVRNMKISTLRMIPILGMQLAEDYARTGSLDGFAKTPVFASFMLKHDLSIHNIIFNGDVRSTLKPDLEKLQLLVKSEEAVHSEVVIKSTSESSHEATFIQNAKNQKDDPVVIMSHGNAMSRDECDFMPFLKKGYNILLVDYAGDYNNGSPSKCSESLMRKDAEADIRYLCQDLNVKEIAMYGISLGGAQTGNHAQVLSQLQKGSQDGDPFHKVTVPFIFFDQTFTSGPKVAGNTVSNCIGSSTIGSLVEESTHAEVFIENQGDSTCDGLNTEMKLQAFNKTSGFKKTQMIIVGAESDKMMGKKTDGSFDGSKNMSTQLESAAKSKFGKNISHFMIESRGCDQTNKDGIPAEHMTSFSEENLKISGHKSGTKNPILDAIPGIWETFE